MGNLSDRSIERMRGVHPDLQAIVRAAAKLAPFDVLVTEGVRTRERQAELYAKGRTKPGRIVTGTMDSRHLKQRCGWGCAVDLAPLEDNGSINWNSPKKFLVLGKAMFAAAAELGTPIRWGYDWDGDGITQERGEYDGPHFELPKSRYP